MLKEPTSIELPVGDSQFDRRFAGIARLYGDSGLARLAAAHVCVIGVGGVGSWAVESLARSAVGAITMIDMDIVSPSNINRQLLATSDTLGRDKVAVMQERVQRINENCKVSAIDDFIRLDNLDSLLNSDLDYVIDCIDDFRIKAVLIDYCKQHKINVLTTGGAGGQFDPSRIRKADLSRTRHDVLLARTRKLLRQDYGFTRNLNKTFGVPCIYSDEQLVYPDGQGGLSAQRPKRNEGDAKQSNALNCAGGMGSITHITATFGFFATAHVLTEIAHAK